MREPFPPAWRTLLDENVVHWRVLGPEERERLEHMIILLIVEKRWEAARGFALTDEVQVTIAAQAALLVLGLGYDAYRGVGTIIVHPTTMVMKGERAGPASGTVSDEPIPLLGVAHYEGPVIIAWDEARANARDPERGHNVVYHEFAHKLDMLDGVVDGTPPLARREDLARWVEVCTAEYEALRNGTDDGFLARVCRREPGRVLRGRHRSVLRHPARTRSSQTGPL